MVFIDHSELSELCERDMIDVRVKMFVCVIFPHYFWESSAHLPEVFGAEEDFFAVV
jgi:hypothetical protein